MAADRILEALVQANIAAALAILFVLLLRSPVRTIFGSRAAYALWLIPLLAAAATFIPAMVIEGRPAASMPLAMPLPKPVGAELVLETPAPRANEWPQVYLWAAIFMLAWLIGAAIAFLSLVVRHRTSMKALGKLTPDDTGILRTESTLLGPAVIGLFKSRIVLPADFEARYDEVERAAIIAHETAHLKGAHVATKALVQLMVCLNWFNPLVHLAARLIAEDQELACDEAVVAAQPAAKKAYANALLKTQTACVMPLGCYWPACSSRLLKQRIWVVGAGSRTGVVRIGGAAVVGLLALGAGFTAWAMQPPQLKDYQDIRVEVVTLSASTAPGTPIARDEVGVAAAKPAGLTRYVIASGGTASEAAQAMRVAYGKLGWDTDLLPKPGTERYAVFQDGEFGIAGQAADGRTVVVNDHTFDEHPRLAGMAAARTQEVLKAGRPKRPLIPPPIPAAHPLAPWRAVAGAAPRFRGIDQRAERPMPAPALTYTEEQRLAAFASNDGNKDGKLNSEEYRGVLKTLGYEDQFTANWPRRDANRDGFVTPVEYRQPLS